MFVNYSVEHAGTVGWASFSSTRVKAYYSSLAPEIPASSAVTPTTYDWLI